MRDTMQLRRPSVMWMFMQLAAFAGMQAIVSAGFAAEAKPEKASGTRKLLQIGLSSSTRSSRSGAAAQHAGRIRGRPAIRYADEPDVGQVRFGVHPCAEGETIRRRALCRG